MWKSGIKTFSLPGLFGKPEKDQSQVILRNENGVFVLTPSLNKSFRFHSDWPNNSSQVYLFESLVKDVKNDGEASFSAKDSKYIFETKTNYQHNQMLPTQEIVFHKKTWLLHRLR